MSPSLTEREQASVNDDKLRHIAAVLGYWRDSKVGLTSHGALRFIEHAISSECICEWEPDPGVLVNWMIDCPVNGEQQP